MNSAPIADDGRLRIALGHLQSLASVERGVLEITACGARAIPGLRQILFAREPSGLYQPRRGAVEALAALGAQGTLIEFLSETRALTDPVEQAGEEAVRNAAARELLHCEGPGVRALLLLLAQTQLLPGAIEVLGAQHRAEAIPALISALADDIARPSAEAALGELGDAAVPALWSTARTAVPAADTETASSRRRRCAALGVLLEAGATDNAWRADAEVLIGDHDPKIAALARRLLLALGSPSS